MCTAGRAGGGTVLRDRWQEHVVVSPWGSLAPPPFWTSCPVRVGPGRQGR